MKIVNLIKRKTKQFFCKIKTKTSFRLYPVSEGLDEWFIEQMDKGEKPKLIDEYTAMFAGQEIWIDNEFYASPHIYKVGIKRLLPHIDTSYRFHKLVKEEKKRICYAKYKKIGIEL